MRWLIYPAARPDRPIVVIADKLTALRGGSAALIRGRTIVAVIPPDWLVAVAEEEGQ